MNILGKFVYKTKYKCKNHVGKKLIRLEVKGEEALLLYILHCLEQFRLEYNL